MLTVINVLFIFVLYHAMQQWVPFFVFLDIVLVLSLHAHRHGYRLYVTYSAAVRSHVEAVADINREKKYRLRDLKQHFFDIKSNTQLVYQYYFSKAAFGRNILRVFIYVFFDLLRINSWRPSKGISRLTHRKVPS